MLEFDHWSLGKDSKGIRVYLNGVDIDTYIKVKRKLFSLFSNKYSCFFYHATVLHHPVFGIFYVELVLFVF